MKHGLLKKFFSLLLLVWCGVSVAAQRDSVNILKPATRPAFSVIANAGLVAGASDHALLVQTIAGVQYKSWFWSMGAGLDYYYLRSVPLFAEVRKRFNNPRFLFLYAGAGCNLPWVNKEEQEFTGYTSDYKNGLYYDAGFGWHFNSSKRQAFLLSAGYTGKTIRENKMESWEPHNITNVTYVLRRITIKVGFQF